MSRSIAAAETLLAFQKAKGDAYHVSDRAATITEIAATLASIEHPPVDLEASEREQLIEIKRCLLENLADAAPINVAETTWKASILATTAAPART
jgi:hypothetical protein